MPFRFVETGDEARQVRRSHVLIPQQDGTVQVEHPHRAVHRVVITGSEIETQNLGAEAFPQLPNLQSQRRIHSVFTSIRPVTGNRYAKTRSHLGKIVPDRLVPSAAVVPKRYRTGAPSEANMKIRVGAVLVEIAED